MRVDSGKDLFSKAPFAKPEGEKFGKKGLASLEGHPEYTVRAWPTPEHKTVLRDVAEAHALQRETEITILSMQNAGIRIPYVCSVIGKSDSGLAIFTVVDTIEGQSLAKYLPQELVHQIDELIATVLREMLKALQKGRAYFWDISGENFVYGHPYGTDEADQIYLVDVGQDGFVSVHDELYLKIFPHFLDVIEAELRKIEAGSGLHNVFPQARTALFTIRKEYNIFRRQHG